MGTLILLALVFLGSLEVRAAVTTHFEDAGIVIDNGDGAKFTLAYPVFVNTAKAKLKIAEKTVTDKKATLKFEGGGQLDLEAGGDELVLKPIGAPAGTQFIYSSMRIDTGYAGGKWSMGGKQGDFPAEKAAQANLYQGNSNGIAVTNPAGRTTTLNLPENTYEQLQDGRQWNGNYFYWQFWALVLPSADRIVIKIGDHMIAPAVAKTSAPAPSEPKRSNDSGTEILKWKDGKKAAFMLAFDDSAPSQLKNVVPELEKRKIVGNFYLVTGNSLYANLKTKWEEAAKSPYVEVENHTFTHKGVLSVEELDEELAKCNEVLYKLHPERKLPRLLGFGQPGGVPWVVSKEDFQQELDKHHLANRPPFYGPPMHYKSAEDCVGAIDAALAKGEMGHLDFHGVGGDWLTTPVEWFTAILDKLEASRDQLWITDVVSWHKYVKERQAAEIKVFQSNKDGIRLELTATTDPALYDLPLTLSTKVPADWKNCLVVQAANKTTVAVQNGAVQYSALPGGGEISIRPQK